MDFEKATDVAQKWVKSTKTRFELVDSDAAGKRLVFGSTCADNDSFYIVGPNLENGSISWHVWSDNPDVLSRLHHVIDSLQSCKEKQLSEILTNINKALAVGQGAAAMADAEDEELEELDDDSDDDYDEAYYDEEDEDALTDTATKIPEDDGMNNVMYTKQGSVTAVKRLLKDWKNMKDADKFGICACPREDNLFVWDVKLKDFPKETRLSKDLLDFSKRYKTEPVVTMEVIFPQDYPMAPPFVRVVRPRFEFLTGHITIGGSICMELLTRSGWRPTNEIENIMIQIRSEIMSDGKATLDKRNTNTPYDKLEAQRAFHRMVAKYGWDK